jgi:hypothetical protein
MHTERIQALWGSFDLISAELVKAKRRQREGCGSPEEVDWLRIELLAIGSELTDLGETPDMTEADG